MEPKFPLKFPPRCRVCRNPCTRSPTSDLNQYGNAGRPYYTCPKNPQYHLTSIFSCFDDDIGVDQGNPRCWCGYTSRRTLRNDRECCFFSCPVGGCRWSQTDYYTPVVVHTSSMTDDGLAGSDYIDEDIGIDKGNPDCSCGGTSRRIFGDDVECYFFVCAMGRCDFSQTDDTPVDASSMTDGELATEPGSPDAPASPVSPAGRPLPGPTPIGSTAASALPKTPTKSRNPNAGWSCTPETTARPAARPSAPVPVNPFGPLTPPASASKSGIKQEFNDPIAVNLFGPVTPPSLAKKSGKKTTLQTRSTKRSQPSRSTRRLIAVLARRHRRVESTSRLESTRGLPKECQPLPRLSRRQSGGRLPWRLRPLGRRTQGFKQRDHRDI